MPGIMSFYNLHKNPRNGYMKQIKEYAIAEDTSLLSRIFPKMHWLNYRQASEKVWKQPCIMQRISEEYVAAFNITFYTIRLYPLVKSRKAELA
jgi:hypothetical protein